MYWSFKNITHGTVNFNLHSKTDAEEIIYFMRNGQRTKVRIISIKYINVWYKNDSSTSTVIKLMIYSLNEKPDHIFHCLVAYTSLYI